MTPPETPINEVDVAIADGWDNGYWGRVTDPVENDVYTVAGVTA